ncbi:MAG: ABC transporter ATP-binding protein [Desulfovibrionaceae bacterium]|nr:ABC transporter ATP-binding protein [Desulfovibrionaceae bacterium]MDD4952311.1 ABC transporter ATP-binding protein [Desulfovibrionaceae bacterium]
MSNDGNKGRGPIIRIRGLNKAYRSGPETVRVLRDVDLDVYSGDMIAVMGPSGTGKSTLLFILGLLLRPGSGSYSILGRDAFGLGRSGQAAFRRKCIGFVFQSCNLFERTTVYENLEFPLIYSGVKPRLRRGLIREALDRVGLSHRLRHPANQLSGGEQQRVAIARALVNRPSIILADEPTGQLDRANGQQVMEHFAGIVSSNKTAMIVVTHDPSVAAVCNRVYALENGRLTPEVDKGVPA